MGQKGLWWDWEGIVIANQRMRRAGVKYHGKNFDCDGAMACEPSDRKGGSTVEMRSAGVNRIGRFVIGER